MTYLFIFCIARFIDLLCLFQNMNKYMDILEDNKRGAYQMPLPNDARSTIFVYDLIFLRSKS